MDAALRQGGLRGQRSTTRAWEVMSMTMSDLVHRELRSAAYWTQWALLELFGPATQDRRADPIEQLKRRYGRPPAP